MDKAIIELGEELLARGMWAATAESCTGGLIGHLLTSASGASGWYVGGVVAYANSVKQGLLGVEAGVIEEFGAVSGQCVEAMARGAARALGADAALAVSGIAGPTGGTPEKPVGTVWLGFHGPWGTRSERRLFTGSRAEVKEAAARAAIARLAELVRGIS